ncbi:hypothetical protein MNBD_NITROSPIRAE01-2372, partial [hydrothermal vent metagenome]
MLNIQHRLSRMTAYGAILLSGFYLVSCTSSSKTTAG